MAYQVARELNAPLDVFLVRKLGLPQQPELAMGAIASGGIRILNEAVVNQMGVSEDTIPRVAAEEQVELERRERAYRGDRPEPLMAGHTVILVDDGLATGSSMAAASAAVRSRNPAELVVAVPVAAEQTCDEFRGLVDAVVCSITPEPFGAVGAWYEEFGQTSDEEVKDLLDRTERELPGPR